MPRSDTCQEDVTVNARIVCLKSLLTGAVLLGTALAQAKLPAPTLSEEQKAAAALAKAKAAHQDKVNAYRTCLAAERAAANYFKNHPQAPKPANAPACVDPGPFVPEGAAPKS
jgi:hypothetical protein